MSEDNCQLIVGDCRELLKTLPENIIDSCVTDPPYELNFMNKGWDNAGVSFDPETWKAVLRVLKPGGYLLAFGGTRTFHRIACAIEDAGFEIRDTIMWLYGCLSDDTEVLTKDGWERYHIARTKEIMVYDHKIDTYQWETPSRWSVYSVKSDTAFRIVSNSTDQVVSRNHRCLVEREGGLVFVAAEELFGMETMPTLSDDLCWLPKGQSELLQSRVQRILPGERLEEICSHRSGGLERGGEKVCVQENAGCEQPSMEGRIDVFQAQGKICRSADKICKVPKVVYVNGEEGRVCYGASVNRGSGDRKEPSEIRSRTPYQPRCNGQQDKESGSVFIKRGSQEARTRASYQTTLATISPVKYTGVIFCPTVSTGAFVARRNGKIFVTGNSGFPKSLNVGKAIDKEAGEKREIVGTKLGKGGENLNVLSRSEGNDQVGAKGCGAYGCGAKQTTIEIPITSPATDLAKKFDGYGTALKPSHEDVLIAQKPLTPFMYCAKMIANLTERIESCKQNASYVGSCSNLSHLKLGEGGVGSVQEGVVTRQEEDQERVTETGRGGDTNLKADISGSILGEGNIVLNTLLSWRNTLAGCFSGENKSTTSMGEEMTIDWRTLNSCLLEITPESIIQVRSCQSGSSANAGYVVRYFNAVLEKLKVTQELSVLAPVISKAVENFPAEEGLKLSPNHEPIIVAMKPLDSSPWLIDVTPELLDKWEGIERARGQ